ISRVMSPRNLKPNSGYVACLVPTYKAGVYTGLGLPVPADMGQALAWGPGDGSKVELPVYYWWSFRTSAAGDFQTLVERLQPRTFDASIGRRLLDIRDIGIPLPGGAPDTTYFYGALVSPAALAETTTGDDPKTGPR